MASVGITKIVGKDGRAVKWRAQVRRVEGGKLVFSEARTFESKVAAASWGARRKLEVEAMDAEALARKAKGGDTVADLIRRYNLEYAGLARMGRTKTEHLRFLLGTELAGMAAEGLRARDYVDHIKRRRAAGTGPATAMNDLIWLRVIFKVARPAWGVEVNLQALEDAVAHLRAHGLVGRANARARRPTAEELARLEAFFSERDRRGCIPMADMMWFAVHSARREGEIVRLLWADLDEATLTGLVRDLKHPRMTQGNDRRFKFTREGWEIAMRQPRTDDRIFPWNANSISTAFTNACHMLAINDLRFHDLRHEATSRLFEAGYSIQEVQLFTLHDDWHVLKRYTQLRAGDVKLKG